MLHFLLQTLALAVATLLSAYVLTLPILGMLSKRKEPKNASDDACEPFKVVAIIPAHNMESEIGDCVQSLLDDTYPILPEEIYVVADHCTDDTVSKARQIGASVLVRNDGPPGKSFAIGWSLDSLANAGVVADAYVILDATVIVKPGFLDALLSEIRKGENIVISHPVLDESNKKWFAKCSGLSLAHLSVQNRARQTLGLSAFIGGRGMAYSKSYIEQFGWELAMPNSTNSGVHPVEDFRHGVRAARAGLRAAYADHAQLTTPLRRTLGAATKQSIRWERGRMANAVTLAARLLLEGLRGLNRVKVFAALDAIQLPVVVLGALCVVVAAWSFLIPASPEYKSLGLVPLFLCAIYGLIVVAQGKRDGINPGTILWAPVYYAWRCVLFMLAIIGFDRFRAAGGRK